MRDSGTKGQIIYASLLPVPSVLLFFLITFFISGCVMIGGSNV